MENSAAARRLRIIQQHVSNGNSEGVKGTSLTLEMTAGEFFPEAGFSVLLPEKLSLGKWNVYRSARSPLRLMDRFQEHEHIRTCHDLFEHAVEEYGNEPCLGSRVRPDGTIAEYQWTTYKEAAAMRTSIGSGLMQHGIQRCARVGLFFINRPEWVVVEQACNSYSFVSVPLYDTLGPDAVRYIINHAEITAIFCTRDKLDTVLGCLPECPSVRLVVVIGTADQLLPSAHPRATVTVLPYARLEAQGRVSPLPFVLPAPTDMVTLCYTSGTTGVPKGVILSHANIVASCAGMCAMGTVYVGDVHISYLPLAHIYERLNIQVMLYKGAAVGFYQGDILKLMDDMVELKPTIFVSVPRLYNRIYDRILQTVRSAGGLRQYLFNVAYSAKKAALKKGSLASPVWDRLVFNKVKERLGGRVRVLITGASPISTDVFEFLQICFGCRVVEGYGMTESTCVISSMEEGDNIPGSVGAPSPACEIKLEDVPEMEYTCQDQPHPRGEVCVRGPTVFQGYFKDPEQTRDCLDEDGWLHTGDIGTWLPGGRLRIIDRKKNIFKLAQGEYIAPEKVENVYNRSSLVAQCFVYGDSLQSELVAVVVADPETVPQWAADNGVQGSKELPDLCRNPAVEAGILTSMEEMAKEAKLRGFEHVRAIHVTFEPFTIENGLLTPTFKVKRPQAKSFFSKEIAAMYRRLRQQGQAQAGEVS